MTRRRNSGEGSLYERKDGYWVAQYQGKYRYSKTKKQAQQKLLQLMTEANEVKPENITAEIFLVKWLESASTNLKPRTIRRYQQVIELHIKPALGKMRLTDISIEDVENLYTKMLQTVSPSTVHIAHAVLSASFKKATKWQYIKHTIIKDVVAPRIEREEAEIFDHAEVSRILAVAKSDRLNALWVLALSTGARSGELLGLQRGDVNLDDGTLQIKRTVYNGVAGTPKSRKSRRTIKLPRKALEALKHHIASKEYADGDWLFTTSKNTLIWCPTFIRSYWKPLLKRGGVDYKNFHTCRHYVASTLLSRGIPITAVSRLLGHDEIILLRTYAHVIPGMGDLTARAMDDVLSEPQN